MANIRINPEDRKEYQGFTISKRNKDGLREQAARLKQSASSIVNNLITAFLSESK